MCASFLHREAASQRGPDRPGLRETRIRWPCLRATIGGLCWVLDHQKLTLRDRGVAVLTGGCTSRFPRACSPRIGCLHNGRGTPGYFLSTAMVRATGQVSAAAAGSRGAERRRLRRGPAVIPPRKLAAPVTSRLEKTDPRPTSRPSSSSARAARVGENRGVNVTSGLPGSHIAGR